MAVTTYARGWLDTKANIQGVLKADEFLSKLVTRNADIPIIKSDPMSFISAATQIFCGARYLAHSLPQRSLDYVKALTIGELMSPELPVILSLPRSEANKEFEFVCRFLLKTETPYNRGKTGIIWVAELKVLMEKTPEDNRVPIPDLENPTMETFQHYLMWLAYTAPKTQYMSALQLVVTSYVGAAKRGTVSERFIEKITTGIRDDIGEEITIDVDVIQRAYSCFGRYITSDNAERIFETWLADIPEHALRLRLTLEQVSGSGLTAFLISGRAIKKYPDFPWGRLNKLTGGETSNLLDAIKLVNGNLYYGFNRDLKAAKSTNFSTVAYVAKELLMQIAGEITLKNYQGWIKKPKSPAIIKALIDDYVAKHNEDLMREVLTEADVDETTAIVELVASETNIKLFS